jgi:type IV secretory pathway component VirB8
MCLPYSPDSPFTNCNAIQDRDKIKNNFINIDSQFAKRVKQKRIRFALLLIMIFIIVAAIAFGVVALVVPL